MLYGFSAETAPLSEYERETLLPVIVKCLSRHIGKDNAITNEAMREALTLHGYKKVSSARIRKIINHIRVNGLIECLMATSYGYYITKDKDEMNDYIYSLKGRIEAIQAVMEAMIEQHDNMPS
ncbi:MAG: hypothetical protein K6E35_08490 [Bacteroidales bacterium]|nr:hypothetical protein [Bacteroidales bacterium]